MKIDFVLTAGNIHAHFTPLFPLIHKVWKERFNLDCYLILVANEIPKSLKNLSDFIILWEPSNNMLDTYIAQVIRILYPCLFENKNILITDLDIFPVSKDYFINSIKDIDDSCFVCYTERGIKQNMYSICYNIANSKTWRDIFNIKDKDDIKKRLLEWYNINYTGKKNCEGWYTDQLKLFEYINNWNDKNKRFVLFKDKELNYKRLHNRQRNKEEIIKNFDKTLENLKLYSDVHIIKPYYKVGSYIRRIANQIIELSD